MPIDVTDLSASFLYDLSATSFSSNTLLFLPDNYLSTDHSGDLHISITALTLSKLFKNDGISTHYVGHEQKPKSFIQNNGYELILPSLFISYTFLNGDPNLINIALSVVANYVFEFFKGASGSQEVKLDIVVEKERDKTHTRISYTGKPEGLSKITEILERMRDNGS